MKCKCGNKTDNVCISVVDGHEWAKCKECFDKENKEGCIVFIWSIIIMAIIFGVVAYFN